MGNNSWMDSAFVSRHLVPQNVGNIIVFVIFSTLSQIQISPLLRKINSGTTTPGTESKSECHNFGKENPQTFKTLRNTASLFSNLDFSPKSEFPKTLDLSLDFPWISNPMAGLSRPGSLPRLFLSVYIR